MEVHCRGSFLETDGGTGEGFNGGAVVFEGYAVGMGEEVGGAVNVETWGWNGAG